MSPVSASVVGFRLLFRRPLIALAEIAWRWTFAAAAWLLGISFALAYLDSLPVRTVDRLLLSTGQPFLIGQALRQIFAGSSPRFVEAALLVTLGLGVAWVVLASLGRVAVLGSVFEELEWKPRGKHPLSTLLFLNFLRAAVVLAAKVAAIGSVLIASSFWAATQVRVADAARMVFLTWFLVWLAWAVLNWVLSTAAIFVVAEGKNSLGAIAAVVRLLQSSTSGVLSASAVFGAIHLVSFAVTFAIALVFLPLAMARPLTLPLLFGLIFAYCFVADLLYTDRLIAYAYLATGRDELPLWMRSRKWVPPAPEGTSASVDKDELILGDSASPA